LCISFILQPWQLLLAVLAGWVDEQQQQVIGYLRTENHVLKEKLGKKRILLSDDQRRRLAIKGKILGRKRLEDISTLFTSDTILRWHRMLVARKWDYRHRRTKVGRPRDRTEKAGGPLRRQLLAEGSWAHIVTVQRSDSPDVGLLNRKVVAQTGSWSIRDAGGNQNHFELLCRQPPGHLAPESMILNWAI
jgi:hypothetical protein